MNPWRGKRYFRPPPGQREAWAVLVALVMLGLFIIVLGALGTLLLLPGGSTGPLMQP